MPYEYHYTMADLKRRGWTEALIREFMPVPDDTVKNPWYRSAPPIRLYLHIKVAQIEQSEEFKAKAAQAKVRKDRAKKSVSTKLEKMHAEIEAMAFKVPDLDRDTLIERACDHYNDHKLTLLIERGYEYTPATPESDTHFLQRITVNYVRHELTPYERRLAARYGKVGAREAYDLISKKIFEAITQGYPWLADECERQLRSRTQDDQHQ